MMKKSLKNTIALLSSVCMMPFFHAGSTPPQKNAFKGGSSMTSSSSSHLNTAPLDTNQGEKILDIQEIPIDNEVKLWHVPYHKNDVITFAVAFKNAGKKADPQGLKGVSDLLSHTLDEGCGDLSALDVKKFLIEKNIQLSIQSGRDHMILRVRTLKKNMDDAIEFLINLLTRPTFEEKAMVRVKESVRQNLEQAKVNESYLAQDNITQRTLGNHVYYQSADEQLKALDRITPSDLHAFREDRLCQDAVLLSSAGNLTNDEAVAYFSSLLKALPKTSKPLSIDEKEPFFDGKTEHIPLDVPQCVIQFTHPGVARHDKDFYHIYMINFMLGGNAFNSRLWNEIRETRGLAYTVHTQLTYAHHTHYLMGAMGTHYENAQKAMDIFKKEWEKAKTEGFSQDELDFSKRQMIGMFALYFDSTKGIVGQMMNYQLDGLSKDFVNERNAMIQSLQLKDINRKAKTYLDPLKLSFSIAGKKP
jgi:zinc protease